MKVKGVSVRIVVKFGGSSLANVKKIKQVGDKILKLKQEYEEIVVVLSAMGKTTDKLLLTALRTCLEPDPALLDKLLNLGEQKSIYLLALYLKSKGQNVVAFNGNEAGIKTYGFHNNAYIKNINTSEIEKALSKRKIVIVAGFCGENDEGEITTLGRGGSDTTAVALAGALNCNCFIYTDVDGVFTVDPNVYHNPKMLNGLALKDMAVLSVFGAGVIEARSVVLAQKNNIGIVLTNSASNKEGTKIANCCIEKSDVYGITILKDYVKATVEILTDNLNDFILAIKERVTKLINFNLKRSQNTFEITFSCKNEEMQKLQKLTEKYVKNIEFCQNTSIISVVGVGFCTYSTLTINLLGVLNAEEIKVKFIDCGERVISLLVANEDANKTISILAKHFNL